MNKKLLRAIAGGTLILAVVAAVLTLFMPAPSELSATTFHTLFFITTFMIITHFGGALLFVLGLRGFSVHLKRTYGWLVTGFVMLALGLIQIPFLSIFRLETSFWSTYGFVSIPFVVCIVCLYVGARGFAKLFGVKNILMSPWAAVGLALFISILSVPLPSIVPANLPVATLAISKFGAILPATFNLWTAILSYKARKQAGSLYIPATAWLATYFILDSACSMLGVVFRYVDPASNSAFDSGYLYIGYAIAGIALLKAAIEFNKIAEGRDTLLLPQQQTFFGRPKNAGPVSTVSLPDVLTYVAGLSSSMNTIDPLLDDMRVVTANHEAGTPFDLIEQKRLATTYLRLERYLAETEPVRSITREELQATIESRFGPVLTENTVFTQGITGKLNV